MLSRLRDLGHAEDNMGLAATLRKQALWEADVYLHMMGAGQLCEVLHASSIQLLSGASGDTTTVAQRLLPRILNILSHETGQAVMAHSNSGDLAKLAMSIKMLGSRERAPRPLGSEDQRGEVTSDDARRRSEEGETHDVGEAQGLLAVSRALAVTATAQRQRMGPGDLDMVIDALRMQTQRHQDAVLSKCLGELESPL